MKNTILFIKATGNPNHNPANGRFASFPVDGKYTAWMPPTDGISGLKDAEKYYQDHLAGIWELTIHRKAGDRKVKVNFNENQNHAYTKEVDGHRVFWPERAKRMCMIFETITHPGIVLENGNRDLFVERVANNGDHDVVVLEWKPDAKEYRFRSSHYWGHEEFKLKTKPTDKGGYRAAQMRGKPDQKIETPKQLVKSSGVSSTFSNLHLTTLEGSLELGAAPEGSCWQPNASISFIADLVKSQTPDWTTLFKANPTPVITLIMPSGARHTVASGDYSFDSALTKATPLAPGARWITLHPNGPGTKGTPVMVQEAQHGSGVFHVIGGAGGKLNYLKVSGIKPESSYKQEASERAKAKTEIKKVKAARDKELGLDKGKGKAREAVQAQKHQGQKAFIAKVAEKMGWKEEDLKAKIPENTTLLTQKKLEQRHHSALLEKANKAVDLQVQHLIADTQARQEAGIVPIANEHTPDDQLTTADLEDARPQEKSSLGFSAHYAERAEEKGATEAVIKKEADEKKAARQANMTDNQRSAIQVRGTVAKQVQAEIAAIREPITADVKAVLASA